MDEDSKPSTDAAASLDADPTAPRFRRLIPAGLLDVGASSLATFIVGYYAATELSAQSLGAYAIFFAAFMMASIIPRDLVYVPAEVVALEYAPPARLGVARQTMSLSLVPMLAGTLPIILAGVVASSAVSLDVVLGMSVGAAAAALLTPVQDHTRRLLHLAGLSWKAVLVSATKLVGVTVALVILVESGMQAEWIPFGALAIGNAVATIVGLSLTAATSPSNHIRRLRFRSLAKSGQWLLAVGLIPTGAGFLAVLIVVWLAGPEEAGFAEAARIVAQPIIVFATGLSAVTSPRSMEAASQMREAYARSVSRIFNGLIMAVGVPYAVLVGFDWPWNPLPAAMPNAYAVQGLLLVTLLASILNSIAFPFRSELIAARKEILLTSDEAVGNTLRVAVAGTAAVTQSFAIPLGFAVLGLARWASYRLQLVRLYRGHESPSSVEIADRTGKRSSPGQTS